MTTSETKFEAAPEWAIKRRIATFLIIVAILAFGALSAVADGRKKLAPDFSTFPENADGTVDVVVQFHGKADAHHFDEIAKHSGRLKISLETINGAAFNIPVKELHWLEKQPAVDYITPDRPNQAAWDDQISAVMDDLVRQQYALDGSGIGIAIIDSGVYNHDDLQNSLNTGSRIVYSESFVSGDATTNDAYGHGTHVSGIAAGNGHDSASGYATQYVGIASNANIINLRVLDGTGTGTDSQVIAGIQRAIQLKPTYNIRVINLSLGRNVFESYALDPLCQAVEAAWKAGIVVVVAAGNTGRDNTYGTQGYATIQAPGNDPNVITVGATKTNGTATRLDDTIASYSSKGPTLIDHIVKPDIVAPGNRIVSLLSPNSYIAVNDPTLTVNPVTTCSLSGCTTGTPNEYLRLSGTSMATPMVSGAAALMIQNNPNLTPDQIKARMMKTAWKGYPLSSWGYSIFGVGYFSQYDVFTIGAGYLDIYAALNSTDVANGGAASPVAVFDPATQTATLVNGTSITWGNSIIWGSSIIWSDSIVWGSNTVLSNSIIWSNSIVWSDTTLSGNSIIWSNSIVWGDGNVNALNDSEDGEN